MLPNRPGKPFGRFIHGFISELKRAEMDGNGPAGLQVKVDLKGLLRGRCTVSIIQAGA